MNKLNQLALRLGSGKMFAIGITFGTWLGFLIIPSVLRFSIALFGTIVCLVMFRMK